MNSVEKIEKTKRKQAEAAMINTNFVDYKEWWQINNDLIVAGITPPADFATAKDIHNQLKIKAQNAAEEVQVAQNQAQQNIQEKQTEGIAKGDSNQQIKSTVANAVSSTIMADYMKYYHLLA